MKTGVLDAKRKTFLVFGSPRIEKDDIAEVVDSLKSGWLSTGPKTARFEEEFAAYAGAKYAVAVNSCTAAMHLALVALGIGKGDEVVTSTYTFGATVEAIMYTGAHPVLVDVSPDSYNLDLGQIERKITKKTRAVMPVHFAGRPCDMDRIMGLARKRGISVIEDAAHAIESRFKGRKVGSIGDFTCFSFYVTKNISCGEGGMITTDDGKMADKLRKLRLHGMSRDAWKRYSASGFTPYAYEMLGYKYNMMDMQAALGLTQLKKIDRYLDIRRRHWRAYDSALAGVPEVFLPPGEPEGCVHARHLYVLGVRTEKLRVSRNEFIDLLKKLNIGAGVHFVPVHLHPFYRKALGHRRGDFPVAEYLGDRVVSLPLSARLTARDVKDTVGAVKEIVGRTRL